MEKYTGLYDAQDAELYDMRTEQDWGNRDLELYLQLARDSAGPVLELACGTGRLLQPLAQAGHLVTGVDRSPHMLEVAKRKLAESPEVSARATLVEGEMTDFSLDQQFGLIIIPFRSFQFLFERIDQRRCLQACARHLLPEGRLVINVFNPQLSRLVAGNTMEGTAQESQRVYSDGLQETDRVKYDLLNQRLIDNIRFEYTLLDGRKLVREYVLELRYFFRFEMEWMLEACGFEVEALYGNFDRSLLQADSPELIFVAKKAG